MHRWSKLFIPTLREAPSDAEVASHKLLLRAGYIRQLGSGIYSYLPLGQRSLNKIIAIVREEMDKIGQEFFLPALNPAELWQESGREAVMGQNLFHLKDRKGAELVLAMTHEEVITSIARNELRSYKQLPQIWYQIQTKFRDEPRPKAGLLRVRQFLMKDSYSFDIDAAGLDESYNKHDAAYRAIFTRCGLEFVAVEADSGAMGGSGSQEFMVYTEAGEDLIASARDEAGNVVYAANLEKATSKLAPVEDLLPSADKPVELHTPGITTIDAVREYLNLAEDFATASEEIADLLREHQVKTRAYVAMFSGPNGLAQIPVVALLRGDHEINEAKLAGAIAAIDLSLMDHGQIMKTFGAPAGYLGPVGLTPLSFDNFRFVQERGLLPKSINADEQSRVHIYGGLGGDSRDCRSYWKHPIIVLDAALENRTNLIAGANKEEYHLRDVTPGRDFTPTLIADIRNINEGELDPIGGEPLRLGKAVEIGHIFKLGCKYSESMGARVLDANGKEVIPIMGCYGIGIERILTAAIESSAAKFAAESATEQYALPVAIAPFEVVVTITNVRETALLEAGERLAKELDAAGIDVLLDDRDERAGVKFKDAELIGVPYRINIGKKLAEGQVELVDRLNKTTMDFAVASITPHLISVLAASKH